MTKHIAQAMGQGVRRLSVSLGEDAGQAVTKVMRDVKDLSIKNIDAHERHDQDSAKSLTHAGDHKDESPKGGSVHGAGTPKTVTGGSGSGKKTSAPPPPATGKRKRDDEPASTAPAAQDVPPYPKRPRGSEANGTHGDKTQEQTRLTDAHGKKVSGSTHESEHPVGYDVLVNKWKGDGTKRGAGKEERYIENTAPAYQEREPLHSAHDGTGKDFKGSKKGNVDPAFSSGKDYRQAQHNALTDRSEDAEYGKNQVSNAVQLNQLGYAHIKNEAGDRPFQQHHTPGSDADVETRQSNDSYDHMVDKLHGKDDGIAYGDLKDDGGKGMSRTEPVDGTSAAEMYLARRAAQTGQWPTQSEIDAALQRFGVSKPDGDAMETD